MCLRVGGAIGAVDDDVAVAGGGMFLVWLVHTSVDWLHLISGVTGIALCGARALAPAVPASNSECSQGAPIWSRLRQGRPPP